MQEETSRESHGGPPLVAFDYIKSQFFRVVHLDGAIGGVTPNGSLHISLFSERPAIPQREARRLNADGSLGELVIEESRIRDAIVRELDVDVIMSLPVAEALAAWLNERVSEMRSRLAVENALRGNP